MNIISKIKEIKSEFTGQIFFNESLAKHSWFNIGGPARIIFKPKNLIELSTFLKKTENFSNFKVIGAGSNTLIRDGGYDGIIIKFNKSFSHLSIIDGNKIIAGASALDKNVSNFAFENSLSGFEFLSCIPGTIGGGIRMNSGCYDEDISKILLSVQAMDLNGKIKVIYSKDIKFFYRGSDLQENLIFISASFQGKIEERSKIKKKINNLIERKKKDQPSKIRTCGSTFKNPPKEKAWKLIRDSGCSGMKIGGAYISEKHCNFFVNNGKAKAKDLEDLIEKVKNQVLKKTGVELELEIQIIGKG